MYSNVAKKKKNDFDGKVGIIRNELLFLLILSTYKLRRIIHKLGFTPCVSDSPEFKHR